MRIFAAIAILAAISAPGAVSAATASTSFNVGVTVVASCSIALGPLMARPQAAVLSRASACLPAPAPAIVAARPRITISQDVARGPVVTVEF